MGVCIYCERMHKSFIAFCGQMSQIRGNTINMQKTFGSSQRIIFIMISLNNANHMPSRGQVPGN